MEVFYWKDIEKAYYQGNKKIVLRIDAINQSLMVYVPPVWVKKI